MAKIEKSKSFYDWCDKRLNLTKLLKVLVVEYWIPRKINFLWTMGVILTVTFILLIISGIFLMMYYKPDINQAFDSVNYTIMQEVSYGWLFRNMHAVAASVTFLIIYIHMLVGIYYGSYKQGRELIWLSGMFLFIAFAAAGFSGYMLPWGQMSYWAAMVITNLFGGIPFIGDDLVIWIRGDFNVSDVTLTRFYMIHVFLLPLLIIILLVFHFYSLRVPHVNNEDSEDIDFDKEAKKYLEGNKKESKVIPFYPMFLAKDFAVLGIFFIFYFYLVCFHYNFAMDPVNFIPADPMVTPEHIYPEWYFLWMYEILRGFFFDFGPIKAFNIGLIALLFSAVIFFILPFLDRDPDILPAHKRPAFLVWFWVLVVDMVVLTIWGKLPPEGINLIIGFIASAVFILLFLSLPFISKFDYKRRGAK